MNKIALHIIFGVITFGTGITFVAGIQLVMWLIPAGGKDAAPAEAPPSILRPVESSQMRGTVDLSCYDMHIIPVWNELKQQHGFQERLRLTSGMLNCSEMIEVKRVDLNRDGNDEILVRGKASVQCGATGNCGYWIFEVKAGKVSTLLASVHLADNYEFGVDEVQASRANGYPEIVLASHDAQNVLHFRTYRFDRKEYVESECASEVPRGLREGAGSWELIPCVEFYGRRDQMRAGLSQT